MSSSSLRRPDPRAALLAALLVMACGLQYVSAAMSSARAAGPQLNIVTVAASTADHLVTLVAECVPAPARPIASEYFTVAAGTTRLPARAVPVISSRPVIGLVVDTSRPGGAGPLAESTCPRMTAGPG